jgi:oxygen-independent coproporphyrinogen-3 oxidase
VDALCKEMEKRGERREERGERIETIYLGGGTPSQLTIAQLEQLFIYINKVYAIQEGAEITIECNPDDVTAEYAAALPQLGINRVSMGAQTFNDQRLRFLNRRHTSAQVPQAVERLRQAGIANISIDLMYGFPQESLADWEQDIDDALALGVEHISAYCLMYEEGTPLYRQLQQGLIHEVDEETERLMYELFIDKLSAAGYEHYEISNFAKPGYRSRHNSSYWTDVPYIGIGAAAHSYDGRQRRWNVSDLMKYINGIESGKPVFEFEDIDADTRYNDRVMLSLRTKEGLDLLTLSEAERNYLLPLAEKYLDEGLLTRADNHLRLSRKGLFVSDMIMSDLMKV